MGHRPGWSLRARLTVLLLATLVPLTGLGIYWIVREARDKRAHAEREARDVVENVAARAGHLIAAVHEMLTVLARLPAVQGRDRGETERLFRDLLAHSPHLENIGLVEPKGTVVASAVPLPPGDPVSLADKEWLHRVVRSGQPAVGGFYVGRITGKPVAHLAHPVLDRQGQVSAVVFADLRLAEVRRAVTVVQAAAPRVWAVVDGQGLALLHGGPEAGIGKPLGVLTGMLRAEAGVPGTNWRAIAGIPEAMVAARVRAEVLETLLPAGLILLVVAAVGLWIARNTWRPLQELAAAVRRIGAGEAGVRIPVETGGEVGEVATAFADTLAALAAREKAEQERREQLEAVRAVSTEITRELDLTNLLGLINRRAVKLLDGASGAVALWDEPSGMLIPGAWYGHEAWFGEVRWGLGEGVIGTVAERREGVILNDYRTSPLAHPVVLERTRITAALAEPLLYHDRLVGVITVDSEKPGRNFTPRDRELLALFASQAAIAIENARLHGAAMRRGAELEALLRATRSVMSGLDLQGILDRILAEAARISGCSHVKVLLLDRDAGVLRVGAVQGTAMSPGFQLPVGTGLSGLVAQTGESLFSPDATNDPRNPFAWRDRELGIVTYLGLPIKIRDEVAGVLTFNTTFPCTYTSDELAYLASFADQAAIAIQNARLYQEIQQHALTLEARVRERTAELEKALRVKAQFLANMSHELRTPLNAVLGFSEVLLGRDPGKLMAKQERYVQNIHTGGKRLLALVNDLLEMAETETEPSGFRVDRLAVQEVLDEVLAALAAVARARSVALETTLDLDLPTVVADRRKLAQVLLHLVSNALRFTPAGGRVTVRMQRIRTAECDEAEFVVTDTGIGIEAGDLERIFRGFEQVDASDSRQYGGAGLGLALVRRLVELHGGRVWAESEGKGCGARFIVRLPLLATPPPRRVLFVQDEPLLLDQMATAVRNAGFEVAQTSTGAETLAALTAQPPDLLVLDLTLPDVDGWEVLKGIRRDERTRDVPILVLTGLNDIQADQALALGAHEFLAKPVSPRVLAETMRRLLARPATVSAPGGPPPIEE